MNYRSLFVFSHVYNILVNLESHYVSDHMVGEKEIKNTLLKTLLSMDKAAFFELLNKEYAAGGERCVADALQQSLEEIGTAVFLDHHGLGIKIVSSLVRSAGYLVIDLGVGADKGNSLSV
ncbi:hypothetical protein [Desulfopila sp. IMCC35008]|uniref:hypothetical protein n=1 Tax=Desulfopila sp. IMCC35008 TaxID=2653858 RepID=UPI0013D3BE12|nr:hypothetical protein [Desulfopila sp. IMCC35008]